jgi:FMN phosphatase YigB (HAD superfamily)
MRIRGLIFDLGHTLIELPADPESLRREMYAAARSALSHHGIRVEAQAFEAALERWMALRYGRWQEDWREYPLVETFGLALAELGYPGTPEAILREAVRAFLAPQEARWRLFPDALPTLDQLKRRGYRLALLTNSGDADHSWRLIRRFGLQTYFDPIVISAAVGWRLSSKGSRQPGVSPRRRSPWSATFRRQISGAPIWPGCGASGRRWSPGPPRRQGPSGPMR